MSEKFGVKWSDLLRQAVDEPGIISKAYSTFWGYSLGNQMSAMWQCIARGIPIGPIATYKRWQETGRQARRTRVFAKFLAQPRNIDWDTTNAQYETSDGAEQGDMEELWPNSDAAKYLAPDDGSEDDGEPDDLPPCVRAMQCYCAGHARGNPASEPCDTSEETEATP